MANRLADYLMAHFVWEKLPDDLLQLFLRSAPIEVRRHAWWFTGREMGAGKEYRLRATAYFEQRLRSVIESNDPEPYRRKLGTISQFFRIDVDRIWLLNQLLRMPQAGFAPNDPFGVVDSLAKQLPEHVDKIVEVTDSLVRQRSYLSVARPLPLPASLPSDVCYAFECLRRRDPPLFAKSRSPASFIRSLRRRWQVGTAGPSVLAP